MKLKVIKPFVALSFLASILAIGAANAQDSDDITFASFDLSPFASELEEAANFSAGMGEEGGSGGQILPGDTRLGDFVPFLGPEVEMVTVVQNNQRLEKFWRSLTPEQWRQTLQDQYIQTLVYDAKTEAALKALPGTASVGKGQFVLTYHNFRYKSYPCSATNRAAGDLLVGVGLRIDINAKFKRGSFAIGLAQLALSASRKKVAGSVETNVVGLANSSTLSQVVGAATGTLTYESLVEASKAYAVAGQALENFVALSNPRIFGFRDNVKSGSCLAAMKAATAP